MRTNERSVFAKYTDKDTFSKIVMYDSVTDMWKHSVATYAKNVAIMDRGNEYTYAMLEEDAAGFRGVLQQNGIQKGDRIAILAVNSYEFVKAFIAAVTYGCTVAVLPPQLDDMTVFGCCFKFGVKALVYGEGMDEKIKVAQAKHVMCLSAATTAQPVVANKCLPSDGCVIMFTGGTTGRSKGALLTNKAVMNGTVNGCYGIKEVFEQRYLLVLPFSHVFGLIRNLMNVLYTGSVLCICRNNKDMFRDIAIYRPTHMVMVPALAELALTISKKNNKNMLGDDLKYIICGAAAVPPYLIEEYDKLGIGLFAGYGLTESANLVSGNPENKAKPNAVGLMYPNQEYRIVDGELQLKGDNMMSGYVGDEDETAKAYTDGWFRTGDLVRMDEDGFLYIVGRIKEIIVLPTGENVSPAEVEEKFNALPTVQCSQVFEDVRENGKHILALEVVPRTTEVERLHISQDDIMQELKQVNESLLPHQRVSRIEIRTTDFDRTPAMKIKRYKKCQ